MKIQLITVGKTKAAFVREGMAHYAKRLSKMCKLEVIEIADEKSSKGGREGQIEREAERLLARVPEGAFVVALDEKGKQFQSDAFAGWLQKRMNGGVRHLVFLVGGPFGHGEAVRNRANLLISLSKMTMPHDLVRLMFIEQLYRAHSILAGSPYHHE